LRLIRSWVAPISRKIKKIAHQNYEMSDSIKSVTPIINFGTTSILQEYFIPVAQFEQFAQGLKKIVKKYNINLLNVGIRYVEADQQSWLPYAPQNCFAFVLYIDVPQFDDQEKNKVW